ncbi:MAG TPA: 3-mercaptopyruvate sulfurtransferase [Devosiaceae bacterium]
MGPLVSTEWLSAELGRENLIVFDATMYLPNEGRDGQTEYLRAHIPGALFFDIDLVADPDTDLPHMAPSQGRFSRLMTDFGVTNDTDVVFYDQKGLFSAARGWWLMRLFGHDRVAVLDGGFPKWQREGRRIASGEVAPTPADRSFSCNYRASLIRGLGDVMANLETRRELVIDARPQGRFMGTTPEPRAGMRSGHIPGSQSLPATGVIALDNTLKPSDTLRELFAHVGADGTRQVVTSCGSGVTASLLAFAMHVAGLPDAAVYDGSWTEWGGRPDTPVAGQTGSDKDTTHP